MKSIKRLRREVDLWDSKAVENYVQDASWTNAYKNKVLYAYQDWLKFHGFDYEFKPYYQEETLPYISTEKEIDWATKAQIRPLFI